MHRCMLKQSVQKYNRDTDTVNSKCSAALKSSLSDKATTAQQQQRSLNSRYQDQQDICSVLCESIAVEVIDDACTCGSVHACVCVTSQILLNSSISPLCHPYPLSPFCLPPRWFTSPGCVLSTSRPPRCTAASESPVISTA